MHALLVERDFDASSFAAERWWCGKQPRRRIRCCWGSLRLFALGECGSGVRLLIIVHFGCIRSRADGGAVAGATSGRGYSRAVAAVAVDRMRSSSLGIHEVQFAMRSESRLVRVEQSLQSMLVLIVIFTGKHKGAGRDSEDGQQKWGAKVRLSISPSVVAVRMCACVRI